METNARCLGTITKFYAIYLEFAADKLHMKISALKFASQKNIASLNVKKTHALETVE